MLAKPVFTSQDDLSYRCLLLKTHYGSIATYEKQLSDEVIVAVVNAVSRWETHGAERPLPALVSSLPFLLLDLCQ